MPPKFKNSPSPGTESRNLDHIDYTKCHTVRLRQKQQERLPGNLVYI